MPEPVPDVGEWTRADVAGLDLDTCQQWTTQRNADVAETGQNRQHTQQQVTASGRCHPAACPSSPAEGS